MALPNTGLSQECVLVEVTATRYLALEDMLLPLEVAGNSVSMRRAWQNHMRLV